MTYNEAKNYLNDNKSKVPDNVTLFIAPKEKISGEANLKSVTTDEENKLALEKLGFLDNDNLEVFATFQVPGRIYYPELSDYLQMLSKSEGQ